MRRKHNGRPFGDVLDRVDEDGAQLLEPAHDVRVVDDLLADVHGLPIEAEGTLDRIDGPLDPGAIAAGRGQEAPLHQTAGQDSRGSMKIGLFLGRFRPGMRKPAARGGRCGGSPKLLTARLQGQVRAARFASPSARDARPPHGTSQWAGRPIF